MKLPAHLFRPDLFSNPEVARSAATEDEQSLVRSVFRNAYASLGPPVSIERCSAKHAVNSNNFRVQTETGTFLLKRLVNDAPSELETQLALAEWLADEQLPLPRVRRTTQGSLVHERGLDAFFVLTFISGRHFTGALPELPPTGRMIAELVSALGRAPGRLRPSRHIPLVGAGTRSLAEQLHLRDLEEVFGREAAATFDGRRALVVSSLDEACTASTNESSDGTAHIDLHPHNLVVGPAGPMVLDYASFAQASAPVLIAFGTLKLLRQAATLLPEERRTLSELRRVRDIFVGPLVERLGSQADPKLLGRRARIEVVRRIFVIADLSLRGDKSWNHVLSVQLGTLDESRLLFDEVA